MNILAIAHERELNGASLSMMTILKYLKKTNNVFLFVPFDDGDIIEVARKNDINVVNMAYNRWMVQTKTFKSFIKRRVLWYLRDSRRNDFVARRMAKFVLDNKIDVIYTNTRVIDLGIRIKKLTGLRHVWHIREFGEEDFNYKILDSYSKHWTSISNYSDVIIANSMAVAKKIQNNTCNQVPVVAIYNGVDLIHVNAKELPSAYKTIKFLISGRICKAKGHDLLIKAIQILLKQGVENFEVLIAGRGDLKGLCGDDLTSEVENKCRILGHVEEIWNLRKDIDVELMCSRSEAFGRVTIEAMMSRALVIGSNSGGTAEIIRNMENGILFNAGDPYDLAKKMMMVIENPEIIRSIVPKAQEEAINRFSAKNYCKDVSKIILE